MLLYQSDLWKKINQDAFWKTIWEDSILDQPVWGISNDWQKAGLNFRAYQLLGVEIGDFKNFQSQISTFKNLANKYLRTWKDAYFQLGFVDIVGRIDSRLVRKDIQNAQDLIQKKQDLLSQFKKYGLSPSFRENMPNATVEIDLTKQEDWLFEDMGATPRRYVKKFQKAWFEVVEGTNQSLAKEFWQLWQQMANVKWIGIWSWEPFSKLVNILQDTGKGEILLSKNKDWKIGFGWVFLFLWDRLVYLYGAMNGAFWWAGYHLMRNAIVKYKQAWFKIFDLLGVSSLNQSSHKWQNISRFKYSLWWEHIEYLGNFDIVHNWLVYKMMQTYYQIKTLKSNKNKNVKNSSKQKS